MRLNVKRSGTTLLLLALAAALGAVPALCAGAGAGEGSDVIPVRYSDRGSIEGTVVDRYTGQETRWQLRLMHSAPPAMQSGVPGRRPDPGDRVYGFEIEVRWN